MGTTKVTIMIVLKSSLFIAAAFATGCDPGYTTGINQYGAVDASNTDTCYLSSDSAQVVSCNNGQLAEMAIRVSKAFYDGVAGTTTTPSGYTLEGNYYTRSFTVERNAMSLVDETDVAQVDASRCNQACVDDEICMRSASTESFSCQPRDVRFTKTLAISNNGHDWDGSGDGSAIYFDHSVQIDFSCRYTLQTQSISQTQEVEGVDQVYNREATGTFAYSLEIEGNFNIRIGQMRTFKVVPTNPGLIFASVQQCTVSDSSNSYALMRGSTFSEMCTDWATSFTLSGGAWSGDTEQTFQYRAFRWNTSGATNEAQTITCELKLNFTQQSSYNPSICS